MDNHTFQVDHHGHTEDPHLARDEIAKAAYRANKAFELVAGTELAETRRDLRIAQELWRKLREWLDRPVDDRELRPTRALLAEVANRMDEMEAGS